MSKAKEVRVDGVTKYLGGFDLEEDAARVAHEARSTHHGQFMPYQGAHK